MTLLAAEDRDKLRPALIDAAAATALALAINLVRLSARSIVLDESTSVMYARLPFAAFVDVLLHHDPNQSLYYFILRLWISVFGESEAAVRFPSAVVGALAVGVACLLGRQLFGRAGGLAAGVLLALNALMVQYAQTARAYSLVVFLVTASTLCLVRELQLPARINRILYVVSSALALYAHYFAGFIFILHFAALVAMRRMRILQAPLRNLLFGLTLACVPALVIASRVGSVPIRWIRPVQLATVGRVLTEFVGGDRRLVYVFCGAAIYGLFIAWHRRQPWPQAFVVSWFVMPIALSFLISQVQPILLSNYLIICVPGLVLSAVGGIVAIRPRALASIVALALALASAERLHAYYNGTAAQDWRAGADYLFASLQPQDGIVYFTDSSAKPIGYYARRRGVPEPAADTPQSLGLKQRVWFVIRTSDIAIRPEWFTQQQSELRSEFHLVERREFGRMAVERYEKDRDRDRDRD